MAYIMSKEQSAAWWRDYHEELAREASQAQKRSGTGLTSGYFTPEKETVETPVPAKAETPGEV